MIQAYRNSLMGLLLENGSHAGLLLSRYLRGHEEKGEGSRSERAKLLRAAIGACRAANGVYVPAFEKWRETIANLDAVFKIGAIDGRLIIGFGSESPLETGLTLHHTYGVPLIPGSALKGLAAHYCDQVWGKLEPAYRRGGKHFSTLFGTVEDGGHILFYDAWITPDSLNDCLVLDVMTVHHAGYYQSKMGQGKSESIPAPSDFDDPTPIPFLSVQGKFAVVVKCDVPGAEGREWANLAMNLLWEAMTEWGIGGKTGSGYGRIQEAPHGR